MLDSSAGRPYELSSNRACWEMRKSPLSESAYDLYAGSRNMRQHQACSLGCSACQGFPNWPENCKFGFCQGCWLLPSICSAILRCKTPLIQTRDPVMLWTLETKEESVSLGMYGKGSARRIPWITDKMPRLQLVSIWSPSGCCSDRTVAQYFILRDVPSD